MPSAPVYSVADYLGALQKLLPQGRAWNNEPTSVQAMVEAGLVAATQRVNVSDAQLLVDAFPSTTNFLLPEWEAALGLPDPCAGEAPTISARQGQVLARFTDTGGQSAARFIALAAQLGYTVTTTMFAPFRAGQSHAGDPLGGPYSFFTWQVNAPLQTSTLFRAGVGHAGDPLQAWGNTVLECSLSGRSPANSSLQFAYGADIEDGFGVDFVTGLHYVRPVGSYPTVGDFTTLWTFTRASSGTYRGSDGLLKTAANNIPRIEYDANGAVLGLLMEGARTNKGLHSENMNGAAWVGGTGLTVSADATVAPDGATTADKLVEDGTTGEHRRRQTIATTAGATVAVSIFLKAAENPRINMRALDASIPADSGFAVFDAVTGTVVASAALGAATGLRTSIERYANGWYRCVLVIKPNGTMTSCIVDIFEVDGSTTTTSYAGDGASGNFVLGFQFEEAAFSSSYIPTTTAPVTRAADFALRTDIPQVVVTGQGTIVAEVVQDQLTAGGQYATFGKDNAGTGGNPLYRITGAWNSGDGTNVAAKTGLSTPGVMKAAAAWDVGGIAVTYGGLAVATASFDGSMLDAGNTLSLGTRTDAGADPLFGHIRKLTYYPVRKPNTFLQTATA